MKGPFDVNWNMRFHCEVEISNPGVERQCNKLFWKESTSSALFNRHNRAPMRDVIGQTNKPGRNLGFSDDVHYELSHLRHCIVLLLHFVLNSVKELNDLAILKRDLGLA